MSWLHRLYETQPIPHAVLVLALVAACGLGLGNLRVRGLSLGVAGVLFAGLGFGHLRLGVDRAILDFVRDFGLVLFVYTIGLQVGPGFFTSLRKQGLPLNLMAVAIVLLGAGVTLLIAFLVKIDIAAAVGLFAGATTNTPALGAAQEALHSLASGGASIDAARLELPALAYAVAYPFGIIGIISTMILLRAVFRICPQREAEEFAKQQHAGEANLDRMSIVVNNPNLRGVMIRDLPGRAEFRVIVSRIQFAGETEVAIAHGETLVHPGDVLLAVGTHDALEKFRLVVGQKAHRDLMNAPGNVTYRRIVVTKPEVLGRSVRQLGLNQLYGVTVTRVVRAGVEMTAVPDLRLQFGDLLQVVGEEAGLQRVGEVLGNSVKALNRTNFVPVFIGVALGIVLGCLPFSLPGFSAPVKLGVAGGPLIVAILLSRIGQIGSLAWHLPANANLLLRELGIVLFLSCVGLKAGEHFFEILVRGDGLLWMGCAALITLVPLLTVGCFARLFLKLNYMNLCGLLAGSMTDPPALAFANTSAGSDAPSVAYATVYPLTMVLRVLVAQIITLFFVR